MSIEEAIARLKVLTDYEYDEDLEALEIAIKALEQEPYEDAISREDALMALTGDITDCTIEEFIARLRDKLSKLPSVTPKEKTGHWIVDIKDMDYCFCSECKHRFDVDHLKFSWDKYAFPPHCLNCGVRMEVEE